MAQIRFLLQEPYKKGKLSEIKQRKAAGKDYKSLLNPSETRIYLWFIVSRHEKIKIKTDEKVLPVNWDFDAQLMKNQVSGSIQFNKRLTNLKLSVQDNYRRIFNEVPGISFPEVAQNIKSFVRDNHLPVFDDRNKDIWQVFDDYVDAKSRNVSYRTLQKYRTLEKSLRKFSSEYYPYFGFRHIDLLFVEKYITFLQSQKPQGRQKSRGERDQVGLLNDSVSKYVENFRSFLRWAYERDYHSNKIFEHKEFSIKKLNVNEIVTLTLPELKQFYEHDFSNNKKLDRVRDVFCFGCFTGQRWGDIAKFHEDQIHSDMWVFEAQKTKKITHIPLVGYASPALEIIKKYNGKLPIISSQKFNTYLKEAAEVAGLSREVKISRYIGKKRIDISKPLHEFLSSHAARRTAVSILLNVERMPIVLVQQITGHSDLKTLQKYINKDTDALRAYLEQSKGVKNEGYMHIISKNVS